MVDRPPTIKELAQDPVFKRYLRIVPEIPENLRWGYPWRLVVELSGERWRTKKYRTYSEAWNRGVQALRQSQAVQDICVVSMRYFFEPPITHVQRLRNRTTKKIIEREWYWLPGPPYSWCFRCRRPSLFTSLAPNHHALRSQSVVSPESPYRCYYCGIRQVGMPSAKQYNFHGAGSL